MRHYHRLTGMGTVITILLEQLSKIMNEWQVPGAKHVAVALAALIAAKHKVCTDNSISLEFLESL